MNNYKVVRYRKRGGICDDPTRYSTNVDDPYSYLELAEVKDWTVPHRLKSSHHDYDDDALYVVKNITPNFVTYYVPTEIANQVDWANATQEDIIKHFEAHT